MSRDEGETKGATAVVERAEINFGPKSVRRGHNPEWDGKGEGGFVLCPQNIAHPYHPPPVERVDQKAFVAQQVRVVGFLS